MMNINYLEKDLFGFRKGINELANFLSRKPKLKRLDWSPLFSRLSFSNFMSL